MLPVHVVVVNCRSLWKTAWLFLARAGLRGLGRACWGGLAVLIGPACPAERHRLVGGHLGGGGRLAADVGASGSDRGPEGAP